MSAALQDSQIVYLTKSVPADIEHEYQQIGSDIDGTNWRIGKAVQRHYAWALSQGFDDCLLPVCAAASLLLLGRLGAERIRQIYHAVDFLGDNKNAYDVLPFNHLEAAARLGADRGNQLLSLDFAMMDDNCGRPVSLRKLLDRFVSLGLGEMPPSMAPQQPPVSLQPVYYPPPAPAENPEEEIITHLRAIQSALPRLAADGSIRMMIAQVLEALRAILDRAPG